VHSLKKIIKEIMGNFSHEVLGYIYLWRKEEMDIVVLNSPPAWHNLTPGMLFEVRNLTEHISLSSSLIIETDCTKRLKWWLASQPLNFEGRCQFNFLLEAPVQIHRGSFSSYFHHSPLPSRRWGSSIDIATGWSAEELEFNSRQGQDMFSSL
jgi:hypothetical protein